MKLSDLGRELRRLRIGREELLKDMAARLEVSSAFLSAVETGRKSPPPKLIEKLISEYELSDDEAQKISDALNASNRQFAIRLSETSSLQQRHAAAVLARSFPNLSKEALEKLKRIVEEDR
ncbi:MAG: helix-turn-helix domain-containing protein [Alphaproteobacteria bacterium]|nr:helix-turn-helix domain-containing protein [Alphaproteobacteria bacterium]